MRIENLRELLWQFPDIDGYWNFDDLAQTESKIKEILDVETNVDDSKLIEHLTQHARVQGLLGKLTEAGATLLLANDLLTRFSGKNGKRAQVRFLIEQGRFFGLSMNSSQSLRYFSKAWELAEELGEVFFSIEAALMMSISQSPKFQDIWLQKALKLAEDTNDETGKLWLSQLYVMNGWHAYDFRKFEESLVSFEKALARPHPTQEGVKTMSIKWAIAKNLRALGRVPEALEMQRGLLMELKSNDKVNGHVFLEMGECLQFLGNRAEAKECFEQAYKELSLNGWYSDNKSTELSRIQFLSKKK